MHVQSIRTYVRIQPQNFPIPVHWLYLYTAQTSSRQFESISTHIRTHTGSYLYSRRQLEHTHTAQTSTRQLEAEKKYLEEELKGGKGRKSCAPSQSTVAKENLTSEPCAAVPIARPSLSSHPRRVINILEDLDKENFFNPKDSRGEKHTVSLEKKSDINDKEDGAVSCVVCVHVCMHACMHVLPGVLHDVMCELHDDMWCYLHEAA